VEFQPKVATSSDQTHACLLASVVQAKDFDITVTFVTEAQVRTGSAPNPWECFWLFTNYVPHLVNGNDQGNGNDTLVKPNGFELGTIFGDVGQTFLKTGSKPTLAIGQQGTLRVLKQGKTMSAWINGIQYIPTAQYEIYDQAGSICLYCEDSRVRVSSVLLTVL